MRCNERHVHEKGLFLIAFSNIPTDLISEQVSFVPLIVNGDTVFLKVLAADIGKRRIKANLGMKVPIKVFKAALVWVVSHLGMAQMPLPNHCSLVSRRLK